MMERGAEFVATEVTTRPAAGLTSLTLTLAEGLELRAIERVTLKPSLAPGEFAP